MFPNRRSRLPWAAILGLIVGVAFAATATAQEKKPKPTIEELTLTTGDGLDLAVLYYPSKRGKEAVPVILLHGVGGSGADYRGLAEHLQAAGHAVLVPDLRGHVGSTAFQDVKKKELDYKNMPTVMYHYMYAKGMDVEVCKSHLIKENNKGQCNIEKLCVVGAGLGATVAMNWSLVDWSYTPLIGGIKRGQDVQALVLLSPSWTDKTVSVNTPIRNPLILNKLSLYILVGKRGREMGDATKIHNRIKAARDGTGKEKDLYFQEVDTNRQGVELLVPENFKVAERIEQFIDTIAKKNFPWKERKDPFSTD